MATTMLQAKQAIEGLFVSSWTGTSLDNVRFENVQFTPPDNEYWVSLDIVYSNSSNSAIHATLDTRRNGFIIVDVYGPPDEGSNNILALLEEVTEIYENKQFSGINTYATRPRHIGINNTQGSDALWYIYRVSIPFYYYT